MSAFICSDETLSRVVYGIEQHESYGFYFKDELAAVGINTNDELADALRKMNTKAVNYRYNERTKFISAFVGPCCVSPLQLYKSLSCLLYQCGEGKVPSTKLYKVMKGIRHRVAHLIVNSLPEYDTAIWD